MSFDLVAGDRASIEPGLVEVMIGFVLLFTRRVSKHETSAVGLVIWEVQKTKSACCLYVIKIPINKT